jgi:AcrR family transcriptional regulator
MVDVANRRGYAEAKVSPVIEEAGVSRPTFYDYFSDRDDCFNATIEAVQSELLARVQEAIDAAPSREPLAVAVAALVQFANVEPARARFLMSEAMAGGERSRGMRDGGIERIVATIAAAPADARLQGHAPDLDARVVIGSVYRMIATRLRRGEASLATLAEELMDWLAAYERQTGRRRWQVLKPERAPARTGEVPSMLIQQMPTLFPPGRPRIPEEEIAENHRLRILHAAARLAAERGYTATKIADITKLARVDGSVFYRLFSDKQEAFAAAHELGFQQVMDITSKAFFAAEGWPQRSWEAGVALTQLLQANPLAAYVGFVEAYAVGPTTVQRVQDSQVAFMFFLQEGLIYRDDIPLPSRVAMEAIIAAIFEIIYMEARRDGESRIAAMLPYIAHLWLTPFMGIDEADAFIAAHAKVHKAR